MVSLSGGEPLLHPQIGEIIEGLILKYTKVNKKQLTELMKQDSYISAQKALELGIIDGIIQKPSDLYKHPKVNL